MEITANVKEGRCPRCRITRELCYCRLIPILQNRVRLVILMHTGELGKMSSTALLARQIFPNSCEIRLVGVPGAPVALDDLVSTASRYLFPWNNAPVLTSELASDLPRPLTLVVPDGSWQQARRMKIRNPELQVIPSLRLTSDAEDRCYRLRRQTQNAHLCTLEAIARALTIIEGIDYRSPIDALLTTMNKRFLRLRCLATTG